MDRQMFGRALRQNHQPTANPLAKPDQMQVHNSKTRPNSQHQPDRHHLELANSSKNKKLFPQKLWDLINDQRYGFCLRWSEDGQLVYLNRDQFEDSYLRTSDNQFHTQKAISFVRQMNMYGFKKVDDCYYENDNFKRDCEHLLKNMIRKHTNKSPQCVGLACYRAPQASPSSLLQTAGSPSHLPLTMVKQQLLQQRPSSVGLTSNRLVKLSDLAIDQAHNQEPIQHELSLTHCDNSISMLPHKVRHNQKQSITNTTYSNSNFNNVNLPSSLHHKTTKTNELIERDRFSSEESSLSSSMLDFCCESSGQTTSTSASASNLTNSTAAAAAAVELLANQNLAQSDNNYFNVFYALLSSLGGNMFLNGNVQQASCQQTSSPPSSSPMKREAANKSARLFKRSVDSILDLNNSSNGNSSRNQANIKNNNFNNTNDSNNVSFAANFCENIKAMPSAKRTKVTDTQKLKSEHKKDQLTDCSLASSHARNLVINAAKIKSAIVDEPVINEVARHTQRFVETLLDTALVIARHSYNSSHTIDQVTFKGDNCCSNDDDSNFNKSLQRAEVSVINMSDLDSAIKLLPSKLSRIVE